MTSKEYINYRIETGDRFLVNLHEDSRTMIALIMDQYKNSGFTQKQEGAIWAIIQYLAKQRHKNPDKIWHRDEVFILIKEEMDW